MSTSANPAARPYTPGRPLLGSVNAFIVKYMKQLEMVGVVMRITSFGLVSWMGPAFRPGPGDIRIVDGGRYHHHYHHRVSKVIDSAPQRTIGGFVGFSRDHDQLYCWS